MIALDTLFLNESTMVQVTSRLQKTGGSMLSGSVGSVQSTAAGSSAAQRVVVN